MTGKLLRKKRDQNSYLSYIGKAEKFLEGMNAGIKAANFDTAALNGVHAVISAIDALLVFRGGVISASVNHEDAVKLLEEIVKDEGTAKYARHAYFVLNMKTLIEYSDARITEKQARDIEKHTERLLLWVKSKLPKR